MAIDMKALKRMAEGDPAGKVMVNRRWLGEVHRLLAAAEVCPGPKPADLAEDIDNLLKAMSGARR
jgi:hypothetical protein